MKNSIISVSLAVMLALSVGLIGCGGEVVLEYNLTISRQREAQLPALESWGLIPMMREKLST